MAVGVLPLQPVAAHAAEPAPVLAPDDAAPRLTTTAPRLEPVGPAEPAPTAPDPAEPEPPSLSPPVDPPRAPAATSAETPTSVPASDAGRVTVGRGDSFWSVAERLVSAGLGRPASDAEVLGSWLALIDANRDRLTDPDDPDLLFPGQVLRLPD